MPCSCPGAEEAALATSLQKSRKLLKDALSVADMTTERLCYIMTVLEQKKLLNKLKLNKDFLHWWKCHKAHDKLNKNTNSYLEMEK